MQQKSKIDSEKLEKKEQIPAVQSALNKLGVEIACLETTIQLLAKRLDPVVSRDKVCDPPIDICVDAATKVRNVPLADSIDLMAAQLQSYRTHLNVLISALEI